MRILILDDDMKRHGAFARTLSGYEVTHVMTHHDAVQALKSRDRFDVVMLDHDLNDNEFESKGPGCSMYGSDDGGRELTGVDTCWFIVKELDKALLPDRFIVHSWNPDGAKNMESILKGTGVPVFLRPFDVGGTYVGD